MAGLRAVPAGRLFATKLARRQVAATTARAAASSTQRYHSRPSSGFVSTRTALGDLPGELGGVPALDFLSAVRQGLATDGGLYIPQNGPPVLAADEWAALLPCSFQERAVSILSRWIPGSELSNAEIEKMVADAYTNFGHCGDKGAVAPVSHLEGNQYILELFHGPTASFKDLALQLTPRIFARAAEGTETEYLILVATSGDTGSAALEGFGNVDIPTMVLYPINGVSDIQRAQMTSTPLSSTHTIGVEGDFDWCQSAVKTLFNDQAFGAELSGSFNATLSAANSMNWGRLLPQVVYHASAYLDLVNTGRIQLGDPVDVAVPCGNFGNILAAVYAKAMGIPFRRFTVAANQNNVLSDFLESGLYDLRERRLHTTISPSIDILTSSNLERMLHLLCTQAEEDAGAEVSRCFGDLKTKGFFQVSEAVLRVLRQEMRGGWADEEQCKASVGATYQRTGYLLDPHTAVAKHVVDEQSATGSGWNEEAVPILISSTAHYGKFASDIVELAGVGSDAEHEGVADSPMVMLRKLGEAAKRPGAHTQLMEVVEREALHTTVVQPDLEAVRNEIRDFLCRRVTERHKDARLQGLQR